MGSDHGPVSAGPDVDAVRHEHAGVAHARTTTSGANVGVAQFDGMEPLALPGLATPNGGRLRRTSAGDALGGTELALDLNQELSGARSGGRALPKNLARDYGDQIGADFSEVKVHDDARADRLARSVESTAFTHGSDIFFTLGSYAPNSGSGGHLLAHELTHVAQNANSSRSASVSRTPTIGRADDPAEKEAEQVATAVLPALRRQAQSAAVAVTVEPGGDVHRLFNFSKWFGKGKKKGTDGKVPEGPNTPGTDTATVDTSKPTAGDAPQSTTTDTSTGGATGTWAKGAKTGVTASGMTLGKGRTSGPSKPPGTDTATDTASSPVTAQSTSAPTTAPTTTPTTPPTTAPTTTLETAKTSDTTKTPDTTATDVPAPIVKTPAVLFAEFLGDGKAPKDAKEGRERLVAARALLKGMSVGDRDTIAQDKTLMDSARVYVGIKEYASLLAAVGMKHTRKADKKKKVKATVNHMSGAEADTFIQANMGKIAHLKGYVAAAVKAGKQADGFIAVLDQSDWEKVYAEDIPDEAIGSDDELTTNAYVSDGPDRPAMIHSDRGTRSTAIHESMHRYSENGVRSTFGFNLNEGITEYFTRRITDKNGKPVDEGGPSRDNYDDQFEFVATMLKILGDGKVAQETELAEIYFKGLAGKLETDYEKACTAKKVAAKEIPKRWKKLVANIRGGKWDDAKALLP